MFKTQKILKKHRKNCGGLQYVQEGTWKSSWFFSHSRFGRKNGPNSEGGFYWLFFKCNIIDCKAVSAVRLDEILDFMEEK